MLCKIIRSKFAFLLLFFSILSLSFCSGCGVGDYNEGLDQSIQKHKSNPPVTDDDEFDDDEPQDEKPVDEDEDEDDEDFDDEDADDGTPFETEE